MSMSSDNSKKVLGPNPLDTRLRNQFLKTNKLVHKDVDKALKELPDDTEWATWIALEDILKEVDDEEEEIVSESMPSN